MTGNGSERPKNPFPGLRPFEAENENFFFGRESHIDALLHRLSHSRFVAVVGTSGSGKSSLVRAGLLPALYGGFMSPAGSNWRVAVTRPGSAPIANLAAAFEDAGLLDDLGPDGPLRVGIANAILERGALGLVELVQQAHLEDDQNVLVLIDQFEELFRFKGTGGKQGADHAYAFVKLLLAASEHAGARIYVLITMRADFLGDSAQFRNLAETINDGLFLVPRLTPDQLREAIEGPIRVAGGSISARLVNRLLNDFRDDPDQLPVLAHALMRTWDIWANDRADDEPLDVRHYEATGGLAKALSRHGDSILSELSTARRLVAEKLFKCLTDRGSDNRGIRRPTTLADTIAITGASDDEVRTVIEEFRRTGRSFLMPPDDTPLETHTLLDISHESLMRIWDTLRHWVDEEALSAQMYRRLASDALLHAKGEAALWRDPNLTLATEWWQQNHPNASWAERYAPGFSTTASFLHESAAERDRQRRSRARAARVGFGILSVAVISLLVLLGFAATEWRFATDRLAVETAEHVADVSMQQPPGDRTGVLLAATAYGAAKTPRTAGALLTHLLSVKALRRVGLPDWNAAAFADHGRFMAVTMADPIHPATDDLVVFAPESLAILGRVPLDFSASSLCGFSDAAAFAVVGTRAVRTYVLDQANRLTLRTSRAVAPGFAAACMPKPFALAFTRRDGRLTIWDTEKNVVTSVGQLRNSPFVGYIVVAPGARTIATIAPGDLDGSQSVEIFHLDGDRTTRIGGGIVRMRCAARCSVAFFKNDSMIAWYADGAVLMAPVATVGKARSYTCPGCYNIVKAIYSDVPVVVNALFASTYDTSTNSYKKDWGVPESLLADSTRSSDLMERREAAMRRYLLDRRIPDRSYPYYRSLLYGSTRFSRLLRGPVELNPEYALFAAGTESGGLATHSTADINAPMLGQQPTSQWPDSYASRGNELIVAGEKGDLHFYNLDRYRTQFGPSSDISYRDRLRDTGDGVHVASFNYVTGIARVLDVSESPPRSRAFPLAPIALKKNVYTDDPQIGYDPQQQIFTFASKFGIRRYDTDGHAVMSLTWKDLIALGKSTTGYLPDMHSFSLTARGNYLIVRNADDDANDWLMTSDGRFIGKFPNIYSITADERFAFVQQPDRSDISLYKLPSLEPIRGIRLTGSGPFALSPDGRKIASVVDKGIQLFDVEKLASIGPPMLAPSDVSSYSELRFSADSRFLFATYRDSSADGNSRSSAVYSVDPDEWRRSLCIMAGRPFTATELDAMMGSTAYPDACAAYASQMVARWIPSPTPSPSPSPSPQPRARPTLRPAGSR